MSPSRTRSSRRSRQTPFGGPAPGTGPGEGSHNALTGQAYRGVNILSLWCAEQARGFVTGHGATYQQWAQLGGQVRKGERGTPIVFYRDLPQGDDIEDGAPRFVARASWVFNAAQVEGAPEPEVSPVTLIDSTPTLDRFVANRGVTICEGDTACYLPGRDEIRMPDRSRFTSAEGYAATLLHELVHWTGHASRLDRQLTTRFGTRAYAAEELIAELGSAFTLADLGIAITPHPNHATYIASWLPLSQSEPRAILAAAAHASRAAEYLTDLGCPAQAPSSKAA
jgi:antirestriction protein ArdC